MTKLLNFSPLTFQFENVKTENLYLPEYNLFWVFISVAIAILSAYAALAASIRSQAKVDFLSKFIWILISSFTLGVGIWAMHFVGMLALILPCHVSFDLLVTSFSILPSILVSGIVWYNIERIPLGLNSLLLGSGVGTMHYMGMAAMQLSSGEIQYNPVLFALSILVAVILSFFALLIRKSTDIFQNYQLSFDSIIMGLAVSGMHYTAISATYFVRNENLASLNSGISQNTIVLLVSVISIIMALTCLTLAIFSKNKDITLNLEKSNSQLSLLLNSMTEGAYGVDTKGYCQFLNR